jgi:hypothetical protein
MLLSKEDRGGFAVATGSKVIVSMTALSSDSGVVSRNSLKRHLEDASDALEECGLKLLYIALWPWTNPLGMSVVLDTAPGPHNLFEKF